MKAVGPAIKLAQTMEGDTSNPDSHVITFWLRNFVIEFCMDKREEPGVVTFLLALMDIQDKNKGAVGDATTGQRICHNYAKSVYELADSQDRAGTADLKTAKLFYNANLVLGALQQFAGLKEDPDIPRLQKYAGWKAQDIMKACKEERKPQIGGPDQVQPSPMQVSSPSPPASSGDNGLGLPSLPSSAPASQFPPAPQHNHNGDGKMGGGAPASAYSFAPVARSNSGGSNNSNSSNNSPQVSRQNSGSPRGPDDPRVKDSIENAYFAIASMKASDIKRAKELLAEALRKLE